MNPFIAMFLAFGCGLSLFVIIAGIIALKYRLPLFGMPAPEAPPPPTVSPYTPAPWSRRPHD